MSQSASSGYTDRDCRTCGRNPFSDLSVCDDCEKQIRTRQEIADRDDLARARARGRKAGALAAAFRARRLSLRLSEVEAAAKIGCPLADVTKLETADIFLPLETMEVYAAALGVDLESVAASSDDEGFLPDVHSGSSN